MCNDAHIGFFRVVDKGTGGVIARYNYDTITAKERRILRDSLNDSNITLYCDCLGDNSIELKIASNLVIYPAQNNSYSKHNENCPKYRSVDSKDWTYDTTTKTYRASSYNDAERFTRKLNQLIYQDADYLDRFDSIKGAKMAARRLSTNSGIRLSSLINPNKIAKNKDYFLYAFLGNFEGERGNEIKIKCILNKECIDSIELFANKKEFGDKMRESQYYIVGENNYPLLVTGWFYLNDNNELILTDFWVRATGKSGKLFF